MLVVDDDANARALMVRVLARLGVNRIFEAGNANDGFTTFDGEARQVDLIVCDWQMPDVTGIEFLRLVRDVRPDVPFIMVTGKGDVRSVEDAWASGVAGYVVKPYSPRHVQEQIAAVLNLRIDQA